MKKSFFLIVDPENKQGDHNKCDKRLCYTPYNESI